MSYVVARMEKRKIGSLNGLQIHNDRKTKNHSNKDIDQDKSELNYDLVGHKKSVSYQKEIMDYINKTKVSTKAVRKDAVVVTDWIVTSDKNFFENKSPEETEKFFKTAVDFFGNRYGYENLKYATVHLDEKTPHMHLGVVPIRDGKLSAKTIFNRNELRDIQSELQNHFEKNGFDLERGIEGSESKHIPLEKLKKIEGDMRGLIADSLVEFEYPTEQSTRDMPYELIVNKEVNKQAHIYFMESQAINPLMYFNQEVSKLLEQKKNELFEIDSENKKALKEQKTLDRELLFSKEELSKVEEEKRLIEQKKAELEQEYNAQKEFIAKEQKNTLNELSSIREELSKADDEKSLREQKKAEFEEVINEQYKIADELSDNLINVIEVESQLLKKLNPKNSLTSLRMMDEQNIITRFETNYKNLSSQEKVSFINSLDNQEEKIKGFKKQQTTYQKIKEVLKKVNQNFADKQEENDDLRLHNQKLDSENRQLKVDNYDYEQFVKSDKKISERFKDFMQEKQQQLTQKMKRIRSR